MTWKSCPKAITGLFKKTQYPFTPPETQHKESSTLQREAKTYKTWPIASYTLVKNRSSPHVRSLLNPAIPKLAFNSARNTLRA